MYIGDPLRFPSRSGRATDAFAKIDTDTRRQSLEGAEYELFPAQHVESEPVDVVERVIKKGNKIGGVGERIGFIPEQQFGLLRHEFVVRVIHCGSSAKKDDIPNISRFLGNHVHAFEAQCDAGTRR